MTCARRLALPRRYDLRLVCGPLGRGRFDPTLHLSTNELWRAANTPEGPVTVRVCVDGEQAQARAWGPGAAWSIARGDGLLGLRDEPELLGGEHPLVRSWQQTLPELRFTSAGGVHDIALRAVVEQRVTSTESRRAWCALVRRWGTPAPGPGAARGLRVPPEPAAAAALPDGTRRALGLEARRGEALVRVAATSPRLERAAALGSGVLDRHLRAIPGVGPWTSAMVRAIALGDPDAVLVGDWHIARAVVFAFTGRRDGDDAAMLEVLAPFAGQRGRVARLAMLAGPALERRAPRAEIPDLLRRERAGQPFRVRRALRFERVARGEGPWRHTGPTG